MTKEEILIGGGILAAIAGAVGLCYYVGDKAVDLDEIKSKREVDQALQKANEIYKTMNLTNANVSAETEEKVKDVASRSNFAQIDIMNKVLQTEQWVRYAYYYMTDNSAELFELEDEIEAFLNSISVLAGFGKMYPQAAVSDIHEYDLKICDMKKRFLMDVDEVSKYVASGNFQMKMKTRLQTIKAYIPTTKVEKPQEEEQQNVSWRLGEDGLYHKTLRTFREDENLIRPFANIVKGATSGSTSTNNIMNQPTQVEEPQIPFKQPQEMSNGMFERLNKALTPAIIGTDSYWYSFDQNGLLLLNVPNRTTMSTGIYPIDTGSIFGGDNIRVLGNFVDQNGMKNTIWVDVEKRPEIAAKVIQNPLYLLDTSECMMVSEDILTNNYLARYIDFSCTPFFSTMEKPTADRLCKRLMDILAIVRMNYDPNLDLPRFRFDRYDNPDAFVIVSDENVSRQIPAMMSMSFDNAHALTFEQRGNTVLETFQGMCKAYDTEMIMTTVNVGGGAVA